MADNIALVVFSPERSDGSTESDLIEALKGKYDALKDKLLAEALMKEVCIDSILNTSDRSRGSREVTPNPPPPPPPPLKI